MRIKGLLIGFVTIGLFLPRGRGEAQDLGFRKMDFPGDEKGILAESQVWNITCTEDRILLATGDGLFSFDGARMRRIYSPGVNSLRDLAYDPVSRRLYSAGNTGYGWWQEDGMGGMNYHPLEIREYSTQLQNFWRVCIARSGCVYFQAMGRLCIYSPPSGEILCVEPSDGFRYMHEIAGEVFVQDGNGLFRILDDGSMVFVCEARDRIMNMVECGSRRIAALERTGLMVLEQGRLVPLDGAANRELSEAKVMSLAVSGDKLLVGTTRRGLYITDSQGRIVEDVKRGVDIDNATILSISTDFNGDIWLGREAGVARIDCQSNEYYLTDPRLGRVHKVVQLGEGGRLLIGSNKGAFIVDKRQIRPVPGITGPVWNTTVFDGIPYIAHDQGLFRLSGQDVAVPVFSETGVTCIVRSGAHPDMFICGTYNGLALLRKGKGGEGMEFVSYIANYSGFSQHILADQIHDMLWIRDSQRGFIRLTLNDSLTEVTERKDFLLVKGENDLIYTIQLDGEFFLCRNREAYRIDARSELVFSREGTRRLNEFCQSFGLPEDRNASGPFVLQDGSYATGLLGKIRFSYGRKCLRKSLFVSQAEVLGVRKSRLLNPGEGGRQKVPYDMNTAVIYLGGNPGGNEIEYRNSTGSGEWHRESFHQPVQIPSLPFGDHDIEFRIPDSPQTGCILRLHILRPWYLQGWAIVGYLGLLVGFALVVRSYYIRQSRKEQERIHLREDLKARSKELANISFNNAKRNRELNQIKALLTDRQTVALIDSYLSDEGDWEKSEEYFNVIYDGLLEKLKSMYPGISKTDMKICVYTKLNLSTKEIADIMNVSVRSVEMARYRLRKRLNLPPGADIAQMLKDIEKP